MVSKEQRVTGFVTFNVDELFKNEEMEWIFAVKMYNAEVATKEEQEELLRLRGVSKFFDETS